MYTYSILPTGCPEIDAEHEDIDRIITKLDEVEDEEIFNGLLRELQRSFEKHFASEEKLVSELGYKGMDEEHKDIHQKILKKAKEIVDNYQKDKISKGELLDNIKWQLIDHISRYDSELKKD